MDDSTPATEALIQSSLSLPGCLLVAVVIALLLAVAEVVEVVEVYRDLPRPLEQYCYPPKVWIKWPAGIYSTVGAQMRCAIPLRS